MASVSVGSTLPLTPDELLTTTRAVRKRLDFTRPVEREVLDACLRIAQQAPSAGNVQPWHFLIVTDPEKRRAVADIYRAVAAQMVASGYLETVKQSADAAYVATQERTTASLMFQIDHFHEIPVYVIPCLAPRPRAFVGGASIYPAAWSFMLAARARGLGTCLTGLTLQREEEMAAVLGIPYAEVAQAGLITVGYTTGADFKPAHRLPLDRVVHWESW